MALVLSPFALHLYLYWCLWKAVLRDCGISLISSLIFVHMHEETTNSKNVCLCLYRSIGTIQDAQQLFFYLPNATKWG